jgi:hypothetical protein
MPKAKTSFVWKYFDDITKNPKEKVRVRQCKMCPYSYESKDKTTTSMVNHLRSHNIVKNEKKDDSVTMMEVEETKSDSGKFSQEKNSMARFLNRKRSTAEWYTRMAVENCFSFNQMATCEFISVSFSSMGMKAKKSRSRISEIVNNFIQELQEEVKADFKEKFENGSRFSVVIDEWTSIRNRRYMNVCIVTSSECMNLGLARCRGSMTAVRTAELVEVIHIFTKKNQINILIIFLSLQSPVLRIRMSDPDP